MKREEKLEEGAGDDAILRGLDEIAGRLDREVFPGQAWSMERGERGLGGVIFRIGAALLAAAAAVVVAVYFWPVSASLPEGSSWVNSPRPPAVLPPLLVMVEDHDSYTLIDMQGSQAIVSFQYKDFRGFPPSIAVLPKHSAESAATHSHL